MTVNVRHGIFFCFLFYIFHRCSSSICFTYYFCDDQAKKWCGKLVLR